MTRDQFNRVLAWTVHDEEERWQAPCIGIGMRDTGPAPWPEVMAAQRIAWHYGPAEAYLRLYGPKARAA